MRLNTGLLEHRVGGWTKYQMSRFICMHGNAAEYKIIT